MFGQIVAAADQVAEQFEEAFGAALGRGSGVGGAVGAGDRAGQGLQDGVEQRPALGAELAAQRAAAVGGVGQREGLPVGLAGFFPFQGGPALGSRATMRWLPRRARAAGSNSRARATR